MVSSTKHQQQNTDQTSASKSHPNFNFKLLTHIVLEVSRKVNFVTKPQLPNLQETVANTILIINISNSDNLKKF